MNIEEIIQSLNQYTKELEGILQRFKKTRDGLYIDLEDGYRLREITIELADFINDHIPNSVHYSKMIAEYYNQGIRNWLGSSSYASVRDIKGVVTSLIKRIEMNPSLFEISPEKIKLHNEEKKNFEGIEIISHRFHAVVMQLRQRYGDRRTLDVNDEYDVQDLFHVLLTLFFNDIRREEWNPSYAAGASKSDFLLPEINTVIEIKKTRKSMSTRELGEQLIVDVAKYKKHPQCSRLICFIYDPDGRITNPRGLESDLSNCDSDIDVRRIIVPKHV